jgi:serine O-acetyltransferase
MSTEIWNALRTRAAVLAAIEPQSQPLLESAILQQKSYSAALAHWLATRLDGPPPGYATFRRLIGTAYESNETFTRESVTDLWAILERDPACHCLCSAFLLYKGFHALQIHRAAHWHWKQGRRFSALQLQHRVAEALSIDVHPAADIGSGVFLDHGTGFVMGETAVIGNNVSLLHGITLGGTGKEQGDRHPKIASEVSIGAGALVLGNIHVGRGARIGAGSVVLDAVPAAQTAVGARARLVRRLAAEDEAVVA